MSDDRLRELERAFAASGALEDEVALARARLRAGVVDDRRVRLAAAVGNEAARTLVEEPSLLDALVETHTFTFDGETGTRWQSRRRESVDWRAELVGRQGALRLCIAAAWRATRAWEAFAATTPRELPCAATLPRAELRRLGRWLLHGRGPADLEAGRLLDARCALELDDAAYDALNAIVHLAHAVEGREGDDGRDPAAWSIALAMNAVGEAAVREALRVDVGGWALGHGDPLRARAEAT